MRSVRVFVSSPGDTHFERMRVERVVERLNGEFAGIARLEAIRWEGQHYKAHATFQQQIPEASDCDVVVAILRHRIGTELPDSFPAMPNGEPYPSGTAYEILSAIEASKDKSVPDVYVFRYSEPPTVRLDDENTNRLVTDQWERLKTFFKTWFQTADGKFKLAFHTFQHTDAFEADVDKLLRTWLEEKILKGRSVLWPVDIKGSPFRGLASFGAKHAPVFFGRSRDITKAVDGLKDAGERGSPFLLVVGASGAGKSSLALAGLEPRLTTPGVVPSVDLWRVAAMRPGEHPNGPVAGLAAALLQGGEDLDEDDMGRLQALPEIAESDYASETELAGLLAHADETCAKPILRALDRVAEAEAKESGRDRAARADLLVVVDQLDELFAGQVSAEERARFAKLLALLVDTGRVWVIATLRADLYERFLKEPDLLALKSKGATYDLAPPGAAEIDEIIRGPADAAGLVYETDAETGDRLDDRLIADIDRPDMLPLLQFTLNFLFEKRVTEDGETKLTLKAYDELGGLAGAIDREGERAIAGLGKEEHERLPRLLRQLATPAHTAEPGGGGASAGLSILSVPFEAAAYDPPAERLVRALVDARILLSSGSEQKATIRLAHQRVLENWRRAQEIVAANAEFYRIRDDVDGLRRRWEIANKARDLLIPKGVPLAEAESIAKRYPGELGPPILGFIAASGKRARFRQRLVGSAAVVFAVLAVGATVAGVIALQAERRAKRNFDVASALVTDIARGLRNVEGMGVKSRQKIFAQVSKTLDDAVEASPDDAQLLGMQATMFEEFASTHTAEGESEQAAESTARSLEIKLRLAELDTYDDGKGGQQDISSTLEQIGDLKLKAADDAGALAVYEQILANRRKLAETESGNAERLRDVAATLDTIGDLKLRATDYQGALEAYGEAVAIRRDVVAMDAANSEWRRDLAVAMSADGYAKESAGDPAAALAAYEESLAYSEALVATDQTNRLWRADVASVLMSIGNVKLDTGEEDGAIEAYNKSLEIRRALAAEDESNTYFPRMMGASLSGLGDAKLAKGDRKAALADFEESAGILRSLLADDGDNTALLRDLSVSLNRVGDVKRDSGNKFGALKAYEESLAIRQKLAKAGGEDTQALTDQIYVLLRIGDVKRNAEDYDGAIAALEPSLAIARKLAEKEPENIAWQREVSANLTKLGAAKKSAGDNSGALAAYEESLAIRRGLPKTDLAGWQFDVASNLESIGDLKLAAGDKEGALAIFEEMLGIDRALVASKPDDLQARRNLTLSLNRLGDVKRKLDDKAGALKAYEECLAIRRDLLAAGKTIKRQQDVSLILEKVGDLKRDAGDKAAALAIYEEMLGIDRASDEAEPNTIQWQRYVSIDLKRLGEAKLALDDTEGALAAFKESLAIRRKLVEADQGNTKHLFEIGSLLEDIGDIKRDAGDASAAIADYSESEKERRELAEILIEDGSPRSALSAYEQALAVARKLTAAEPGNVDYQYDVSVNLQDVASLKLRLEDSEGALSDYEEALAIRRRLVAAEEKNSKWLYGAVVTLEKIGDLKRDEGDAAAALKAYEEMVAADRKLVAAEPDDPDWQRNLGIGQQRIAEVKLKSGDEAGALALYQESLEIRRALVKLDPENERYQLDLSLTLERLGDLKRRMGDNDGALALYVEMLDYDREVAAANIGETKRQRIVSVDLNKISDLKLKAGDTQGALAAAEESLAIARHIALSAPNDLNWQRDVSVSLERVGNTRSKLGNTRAALRAYEEMLSIDRMVADTDSKNIQRKRDVILSLKKVGDMRAAIDDFSGALANYEEGLALTRKLAKDDDDIQSLKDFALILKKVGEMRIKIGDLKGALKAYEEDLALKRKIVVAAQDDEDLRRELTLSLERVGNVRFDLGDMAGARAAYEEDLGITRALAEARQAETPPQTDLVISLYKFARTSKGSDKEAAIDEALRILAALDGQGRLDETQKGWKDSILSLRDGPTP